MPGRTGGKPTVGHSYPGTILHEVMHVFWDFWDGFPEPCDKMNLYTFRRDVAQFAIDVRDYYHSDFSEPFPWESESWRLYYNMMIGLLEEAAPEGEDFWEILERQGIQQAMVGILPHNGDQHTATGPAKVVPVSPNCPEVFRWLHKARGTRHMGGANMVVLAAGGGRTRYWRTPTLPTPSPTTQ